jgi:hypothetical protein
VPNRYAPPLAETLPLNRPTVWNDYHFLQFYLLLLRSMHLVPDLRAESHQSGVLAAEIRVAPARAGTLVTSLIRLSYHGTRPPPVSTGKQQQLAVDCAGQTWAYRGAQRG